MKLKIRKKDLKKVAVLLVIVIVIGAVFGLLSFWEKNKDGKNVNSYTEDDGRVLLGDQWYVPNDDLETILVMGLDKYDNQRSDESYNNNQQADFLMLLIVDHGKKTYSALHINRDTMADIQVLGVTGEKAGTVEGQLALAYTYGSGKKDSCHNTVYTVSNFLYGIDIDHYVSVTLDAVPIVNDLVGGVTLTMTEDMTSVEPSMEKGATVTLNGSMALGYVRARGELQDSSNISRMERQRDYLKALNERFLSYTEKDEAFFIDVMKSVSSYMISDLTANQLSTLYDEISSYDGGKISTIEGEAVVGKEFMEFYANEALLKSLVIDLFYTPVES